MTHFYQVIQHKVTAWRQAGYPCEEYPAVSEILEYAILPESRTLRYLRAAQLQALETYWYLRLVEGTPHIFDLYQRYYPRVGDILNALGLDREAIKDFVLNEGLEALWDRIREGGRFVKTHKLESIHETLTLAYPSYILALAMGAGKTMLIGAIIAAEFALALEYPDAPFIQNALVFAPGLTILESLRELAELSYDKILPPRLHRPFEASYKLLFTRDGEKDLPVIRGSRYNIVVTNTEKIRIQKRTRRHHTWTQMEFEFRVAQSEEVANLRLQAIASLPNLGIFSDEAHHTYGTEIGKRLKRVRQTVDYLHEKTDLICVINTTGTPYYERQPLRDVVIWYGLSQGIRDNILKAVDGSIFAYDFDNRNADQFVGEVVRDFIRTYGDVTLPNGAPSKLAIYFPQIKDLVELRPIVDTTLMGLGYPTDLVISNHSESTDAEEAAFNRLNNPDARHRVILLVNRGTEGWNCPSLFACALARKLKTSQNFVLQASSRCLRQIPGNPHKARIYLSADNRAALDRQLQETYGETISDLRMAGQDLRSARLVVRKIDLPPLVVTKIVKQVVPADNGPLPPLTLTLPTIPAETVLLRRTFTPQEGTGRGALLQQVGEEQTAVEIRGPDLYTAATQLAAVYRLDTLQLYTQIKDLYGGGAIVPDSHLPALAAQIEESTCRYRVQEEEVEQALALLKPEGFTVERDGDNLVYTAEITYHKSREHLLLTWDEMLARNPGRFGFHYTPYNFDSNPEKDFFRQLLEAINIEPDQVENVYFTGALTDPRKTDFFVEYLGVDGKPHRYSPDFVLRRKDGRCCIIEIKAERERNHPIDGETGRKAMAMKKWTDLNPEELRYEIIFTSSDSVAFNQLGAARRFIESEE